MPMYRIRTEHTGMQGGPYLSTLHFDSGAGTAEQAHSAVAAFWVATAPERTNDLSSTTLGDVELVDEATGQLLAVTDVGATTSVGSSASEGLAFTTQGLVRWRTGAFVGGREVRGRLFIPGATEGDNVDGQPGSASYRQPIDDAAAVLIADLTSALVVWSRPKADPPDPGNFATVTSGSTWTQWAVLRSRRD